MKLNIDNLEKDLEDATNAPKWTRTFRDRRFSKGELPFLVIYQAVAIARNIKSPVFDNKGAGIAIATKQLQDKGFLLEGSNKLSALGDIREIAVLKRLGEKKAKSYVSRFNKL